jgi:hypothetical protein
MNKKLPKIVQRRSLKLFLALSLAAASLCASPLPLRADDGDNSTPQQQPKWTGTATCQCKLPNGQVQNVTCSCDGALSYDDAKNQLQMKINAQVSGLHATPEGSVNFSISKQF